LVFYFTQRCRKNQGTKQINIVCDKTNKQTNYKGINLIQGRHAILAHLNGYVNAVMQLFPEIGLEESKFDSGSCTYAQRKVSYETVGRETSKERAIK
jgi:hypothetical protein